MTPKHDPDVTLTQKDETLLEALFESEAAFAEACKKAGLSLLAAAKWIELPRIEAAIAQIKRMRQTQQDLAIQQQRTLGIESLAKLLCCSEPVKPETIRKAAMALLQLTVTPKEAPSPEVKQDKGMSVLGLADLLFPAGLPPEPSPGAKTHAAAKASVVQRGADDLQSRHDPAVSRSADRQSPAAADSVRHGAVVQRGAGRAVGGGGG